MLSIFLAVLVHFLAPAGGALGHAAVQAPVSSPGHHFHNFDSVGTPGG
jgi:hypothetical protein